MDREFFEEHGYVVVDTDISHDTIDTLKQKLIDSGISMPVEQGQVNRGDLNSANIWKQAPEIIDIATSTSILEALACLYEKCPVAFQTILFDKGSELHAHSDGTYVQTIPENYMCAAWVALEDITEEAGCLYVCPGSHRLPQLTVESLGLLNYDVNLRHDMYEAKIRTLIADNNFEKKLIPLKKGQAVLWASNMIHGGSEIKNDSLTRWSQGTHYFLPGADKYFFPRDPSGSAARDGDITFDINDASHRDDLDRIKYNKVDQRVMVEWEVTMKCNYRCFYCTNLDPSIKPVLDKDRIETFIKMLGTTYPGIEIFVFGGEPFIHPHIEYIIKTFNKHSIPFVIQTNLSKKSIDVMNNINSPFTIQVSIHPTQVKLEDVSIPPDIDIRVIDVMYTGREAVKYYLKVKDKAPDVYLTPVADFGNGVSDPSLREFNKMRKNPAWQKIINFENVKKLGHYRSDLWEDYSPKGKPCLYTDTYFLYSPNLDLYNCCFRMNHDGICPHDKCFLM